MPGEMNDHRIFKLLIQFRHHLRPDFPPSSQQAVLYIPSEWQQQFIVMEQPVQHILIVEFELSGVQCYVLGCLLTDIVLTPIVQIHHQNPGIEIGIGCIVSQTNIVIGLPTLHILHRCQSIVLYIRVPQSVKTPVNNKIAVHIDNLVKPFG